MQPTKEQEKEFWEWCGLVWVLGKERWRYEEFKETNGWWQAPSGRRWLDLPPTDLNHLFEYAVPEYRKSLSMSRLFERWLYYMEKYGEAKPETTLFLVLNEASVLIKQEGNKRR